MDWASFILITYAFILALIVAAIVLKGINSSKSRYQKLLEEKELKLSSIQLELEQTMETLSDQAAAMELAVKDSERREKDAANALQQRLLEVQGAMVAAQSRLLRLEQGMEEMRRKAVFGIEIPAQTPPEALPTTAGAAEEERQEAPRKKGRKGSRKKEREELDMDAAALQGVQGGEEPEQQPQPAPVQPAKELSRESELPMEQPGDAQEPTEEQDIRSTLVEVFERGGSVMDASRQAGCSSVEASMIYNQWKRGFFS